MASPNEPRLFEQTDSIAEIVFVVIVIVMLVGPVSGGILSVSGWASSILNKSFDKVESTKNLAEKLLESSNRIRELEQKLTDAELELSTLRRQAQGYQFFAADARSQEKVDPWYHRLRSGGT